MLAAAVGAQGVGQLKAEELVRRQLIDARDRDPDR